MIAARRTRLATVLAVGAGLALLLGANAHLLVVAFESQPDCVDHVKLGDTEPGQYSAAKSSC